MAILQDLQGPKIRLGTFGPTGGGRVDLVAGRTFTLCARPVEGTAERASLNHPEYLANVRPVRDARGGRGLGVGDWLVDRHRRRELQGTTPV